MNDYPMHINKSSSITDDKVLTKYAWAFTLGDGGIYIRPQNDRPNLNVNAHFECNQVSRTEEYSLWRANILSNITSVNLYKRSNNEVEYIITRTNNHPLFTTIKNRMYLNERKVIDPHYLKLLDWESLAILYQDDGCLTIKDKDRDYWSVFLSTESFSYGDNILLQRAIKDKFNILFRISRNNSKSGEFLYRLQLQRQEEIDTFLNGVEKFIQPCFQYKLRKTFVRHTPERDGDIV